jgi:hypothetical protein
MRSSPGAKSLQTEADAGTRPRTPSLRVCPDAVILVRLSHIEPSEMRSCDLRIAEFGTYFGTRLTSATRCCPKRCLPFRECRARVLKRPIPMDAPSSLTSAPSAIYKAAGHRWSASQLRFSMR